MIKPLIGSTWFTTHGRGYPMTILQAVAWTIAGALVAVITAVGVLFTNLFLTLVGSP